MAVPALNTYGPVHTVLEEGGGSLWDKYLDAVQDVVFFKGLYHLFYVGFDSIRGDGGEGNRALGVATSVDGFNWVKSPYNPIITFSPANPDQDEEGVQGCCAVVHNDKIHLYYGGLRWTGGSNVDIEIRYRESSDGHVYTNDTLIRQETSNEISPIGAYVDSSGDFHVYYAGALTGGVGDLKRLTGSSPTDLPDTNTLSTSDFYAIGNVIDYDASNILITLCDTHGEWSQRLIAKSSLGTLGAEQQLLDTGSTNESYGIAFLNGSQWILYNVYWPNYEAIESDTRILARCSPDVPAFKMAASANIAASAATSTTAQLTAPSGKTTGDFEAARISDDTNPLPSIDLTADAYTEGEWCQAAQIEAIGGITYEFRVTDNGTVLDTYAVTPELLLPVEIVDSDEDGVPIGLIESASVEVVGDDETTPSDSDTLPVNLTELSDLGSTVSRSESFRVWLTEVVSMVKSWFRTEDLPVQLTTVGRVSILIVGDRDLPVGLTEQTVTVVQVQASETFVLGLQETTEAIAVTLDQSDVLPCLLIESGAIAVEVAVADAMRIGLVHVGVLSVVNADTDGTAIGLLESSASVIRVSRAEDLPVGMEEQTSSVISVQVSVLEPAGLVEDSQLQASLTAASILPVALVTSSQPIPALLATEVFRIGLTESAQTILVRLTPSEALALGLSDTVRVISITLSRSTTLPIGLIEDGSKQDLSIPSVTGSDTFAVVLAEAQAQSFSVLAGEALPVHFLTTTAVDVVTSLSETLKVGLSDAVTALRVLCAAAETVMVGVIEDETVEVIDESGPVEIVAQDVVQAGWTEAVRIAATLITYADSLGLSLTEVGTRLTVVVGQDETVVVIDAENGTVVATDVDATVLATHLSPRLGWKNTPRPNSFTFKDLEVW